MLLEVIELFERKYVVSIAAITYSNKSIIIKTLVLRALVHLTNSDKYRRYSLTSSAYTLYYSKRLAVLIRRHKYLLLKYLGKDVIASSDTNTKARLVYILLII